MSDRRFGKDFFTPGKLPVSDAYLYPRSRGPLYLGGALVAALLAAGLLADAFVGRANTVSGGTLSADHALFADACSTCHTAFQGTPDVKCESCHEKVGDGLGIHGWERHYLYRSTDYDRSAPGTLEASCADCHREHQGRDASLQRVADSRCATCHDFGSFSSGHPEFDFAAEGRPDDANLTFPHILHVREVMDSEGLRDLEAVCLTCHVPDPEGRSFRPLSFESQCDQCHLEEGDATPLLPRASGDAPGVRSLAEIRAEGTPGSLWALYWNPNEFTEVADRIRKRPVYHEDPWVMQNLRRLRRDLYPGAELADLLHVSADLPGDGDPRGLHREAVETLRSWVRALRGEPSRDVQDELNTLTDLLDRVEDRLEDPYASLDDTRFLVDLADRAAAVARGEVDLEAYQTLIEDLTEPCTQCHLVERATISRVQTDQRTLRRAEFDHRAHILHARCLDCHTGIPVREYAPVEADPPPESDRAAIQNVPGIASCRSCHGPDGPEDRCTSCHLFHPDRSGWSNLTRYERSPR